MSNWKTDDPCTACGHQLENEQTFHHLFTRKVYPEFQNEEWNKIPVCLHHHNEFHSKGTSHMANNFRGVEMWLKRNGWFFDNIIKKWRRDGF